MKNSTSAVFSKVCASGNGNLKSRMSIRLFKLLISGIALCFFLPQTANAQYAAWKGLPLAYWDFEVNSSRTTVETTVEQQVNTTGNTFDGKFNGATTTICGIAGNGTNYGAAAGEALACGGWATTNTLTSSNTYYQFSFNTSGFSGITFGYDIRANGTLATYPDAGYSYSTDGGTTFSTITAIAVTQNGWVSGQSITLPVGANDNSHVIMRIYGYYSNNSGSCANGILALDNVGVYASGMVANAGSKTSADEEAIASGLQSGTVAGAYPRQTFTIVGPNSELIINNNSANGLSMAAGQTFSVSATGTVTFKNLGVIFGTGNFTLLSGCTLKTQNTAGITAATGTLTGCVVTTGGRTFNTGANYVYNGTALQSTGTGLPTAFVSPGSVTVDNTFSVTLTSATTMGANDTVNLKTGAFNIGAGLTFNTATAYIQIDNGSFNIAPTFSVGNAVNIIYKSLNYGGTASTSSITTGLEIPTATNILKDFTINKGSATITLASTPTVNGTVTMTAGLLNLSTFDLNVSAASPAVAPGTFTTSNMIIANSTGQLKKQFSGNGSYLYPIGDATNYTPITLSVTGATYPGGSYAGANLRGVKHPNNANTTDFINRYWSVSLSGITSPTTSVTAATYVVGDVVGTEANIAMGQYPGATPWIRTTTTNAVTHTLTTAPSTFTNAASDFSGISVAADGPTVTLASATVPCGSVHTFTAVATRDAPYTYSWAPSTGLSATTGAIVTSSSTVTTTYTVTLTDGNGFTASATATLTVTPFVPNVFPTTALYCAGGGALVTTTASGGASYIWTPGGATTNTLAVGPPSNTVYTVTATSSLGCVGINTFSHYTYGNRISATTHEVLNGLAEYTDRRDC